MGLSAVLRKAVAVADRVTGGTDGVQVTVQHRAVPQSGGVPVVSAYGHWDRTAVTPVARTGVWSDTSRLVQASDGREVTTIGSLTLLASVAVHELDAFTLPDGSTPPIARVERVQDAAGVVMVTVHFGGATGRGIE